MANKIIIDVSRCEFYHDGKCLCEFTEIDRKIFRYYSCNKFSDCYYRKAEYYRQALKDIEEILNTPPDDTRLGKIILRLAEVEY